MAWRSPALGTDPLIEAALRGELKDAQAKQLALRGPEAVTLMLPALAKRLRKHRDGLFTFPDKPAVPFENNLAERAIRPTVLLRKNSRSNRCEQGAATQAILMSVYRTLKLRGLDPTKTITTALRTYLPTGQRPPPPNKV
jgi:transposase